MKNLSPSWLFMARRAWRFLLPLALALPLCGQAAGTWTPLANNAPGGVALMLPLSDGTVMCQNSGGATWYRLTPDIHGSYVNGTWTTQAPMHDSRRYYSSQVLRDGRVFVAGGEYGTGGTLAEIYDPLSNTWTQAAKPPSTVIDNISETLPNGNVLEGFPGSYSSIYNIINDTWSANLGIFDGQDEASWVKLQDGSIITIDPFDTATERFVPALNKWVKDTTIPVAAYGYGGELGAGLLLPTGQAIFFGATGSNVVYTPWTTNYTGIYTPNGATNAGTWTVVASTPNFNAPVDAPAAMMVNGKILCCMANTNNGFGSSAYFYEYDYVADTFTAITSPSGGASYGTVAYGCTMLDLPDGTVLFSSGGGRLYDYRPVGSPLASGIPVIAGVTTNLDGSFHLTGTGLNGISEGAAYGDDSQMNTDYPIARMTNSAGNTLYCRTYNWSTCNLMTGTNLVSTEMTLPAGLLAGTYPLVVTANGFASAPYSLAINGTPLPPVAGLAFSTVAFNKMIFHWNKIGLTETGYVVQRATDGANFSTVASLASTVTSYTDNAVTPMGQYYYRVLGTNSVGLGLNPQPIFAASLPVTPVPSPWQNQDVGGVLGSGASGQATGTFTVIGSGTGISEDNDEFQFVYQPVVGDVAITARVVANQNTGSNALAGVMIRNSLGDDVAGALMAFAGGAQTSIFEHRADAAGQATYGLKVYGEPDEDGDADEAPSEDGDGGGVATVNAQPASAPLWVRLVRSGNTITGFTSTDGSTWMQQGTTTIALASVVEVGLAVTSGTYNLLNTSTFDNVTVGGTPSALPPPMAEWKLDETSGTTAEDSIDSFDGLYSNCTLGQPGATPNTGYSAGFNGTSANISIPPLNLNSNVLTITGWVNRNGNQSSSAGIFFNRANSTVSGLTFGNSTANELSYTWNNNASTYNWHSGLIVPNNQWTFVALVIEPTRARLYMVINGVMSGQTNNVANAVQAFDGTSYLGEDSGLNSRSFNGLLDEVQFFNQALTPAQLASLTAPPVIVFTTPTDGQEFLSPANVSLNATVSGAAGHTINLVQFFNGDNLISQFTAPPYTNTVTNLGLGTYAFSARLFYDSGLAVDSNPTKVIVETTPAVPQNVLATAVTSNEIYISWSPAVGADGYILSRNGSPIATFAGTVYLLDTNLAPNTDYCYTVVATNQVGTSATSASSCAVTPAVGGTLTWDAGGMAGPQDGNGNWGSASVTWWNGTSASTWVDGSLAVFGSGTTTNCTVTIANAVSPRSLMFNANNGGTYTIASSSGGGMVLSGQTTVFANTNATINAALSGAGGLVMVGPGTLTLTAANTHTGGIRVNGGTIVANAPNGTAYGTTGNGNLLVNSGGVVQASGDNSLVGQTTSGAKNITINAGGMVTNTSTSSCHLNAVILNGGTLAANTANGSYGNWNFDHGVATLGQTNVSTITGGNATVSQTGGTVFNILAGDTVNVSTVLSHVGTDVGLVKVGTGTLTLLAANTYTTYTTVNAGTLLVNGSIGAGAVTVNSGATLGGTGVIGGVTTVHAGGTLAPGASIGTLTLSHIPVLGGTVLAEINRTNTPANANQLVLTTGTLTFGGTLTVQNTGDAPQLGDSFVLFSAPGYAGKFTATNLPALSPGLGWSWTPTNGTLTVINVMPTVPVINGDLTMDADGFRLSGTGGAGQTYILQGATNLVLPVVWLPLQTNTADGNGLFNFTDPQATNYPSRFYRVTTP